MPKRKRLEITSSKQALEESMRLPAVWSDESRLTQRLLVYIASLLERQLPVKQKRKPTAWQTFLGKAMKSGKTVQEAAVAWKAKR